MYTVANRIATVYSCNCIQKYQYTVANRIAHMKLYQQSITIRNEPLLGISKRFSTVTETKCMEFKNNNNIKLINVERSVICCETKHVFYISALQTTFLCPRIGGWDSQGETQPASHPLHASAAKRICLCFPELCICLVGIGLPK